MKGLGETVPVSEVFDTWAKEKGLDEKGKRRHYELMRRGVISETKGKKPNKALEEIGAVKLESRIFANAKVFIPWLNKRFPINELPANITAEELGSLKGLYPLSAVVSILAPLRQTYQHILYRKRRGDDVPFETVGRANAIAARMPEFIYWYINEIDKNNELEPEFLDGLRANLEEASRKS